MEKHLFIPYSLFSILTVVSIKNSDNKNRNNRKYPLKDMIILNILKFKKVCRKKIEKIRLENQDEHLKQKISNIEMKYGFAIKRESIFYRYSGSIPFNLS